MKHSTLWIRSSLLVILLFASACQPIQPQAAQPSAPSGDAKIQNAMSAAPPVVAKDATILDWPAIAGGELVVLRQGTNGWICYTDRPVSPGNDPQCYDKQWNILIDSMTTGKPYTTTAPGIGYMLQGGSDESNTDPMATGPAPGDDWISTPPHIMILAPGGFDAADFAAEPKQDEPYIMWDGTPYEHLMVPVVPTDKADMGDADAVMQNTLSSAPAGIAMNATIMGYPAKEGDPLVMLREGTNGWVCNPDRAVSPGNDPSCNNANMEIAFGQYPNTVVTKTGISYMLQGGSDESNMDPTASGPAPGDDWVTTPPHIMLMVPGGFDAADFTTDHTSGYPYIMFDDSPVEHLMIPVNATEMGHGEEDAQAAEAVETQNASKPIDIQTPPTPLPTFMCPVMPNVGWLNVPSFWYGPFVDRFGFQYTISHDNRQIYTWDPRFGYRTWPDPIVSGLRNNWLPLPGTPFSICVDTTGNVLAVFTP